MAKVDERADIIGASILSQAEQESKELIEKARTIRDVEIHEFEDRVIQDMFAKMQKESAVLRAETVKAVSVAQVTARQSLLRRREELSGMVMAAVWTRLLEYAKTPEYRAAVKDELASLKERYDHSASILYLRDADMDMAAELCALLPGSQAEADPAIKAGGWKLQNTAAEILIDETLDTRLSGQWPWFLQNSGLQVV